jgi:MoaA/NifB/PqqE/SkfB family radical SAM enzyme
MKQMMAALRHSFANRFSRWWEFERMPWLDWVQVEVTSRCNAACTYCPRTVYRSNWSNRDLSLDKFERMLPLFTTAKMIHLQGWGEPFLHTDFFEMVARLKNIGCKVSTTTNGMLLDSGKIGRLVESGIDHIAFSVAGIGEKNDNVRKKTEYRTILQAITDLSAEKIARHVETPTVNIAFLLLRSHLRDVHRIIPAFKDHGIEQVIVSTLDFVPSKDLQEEILAPADENARDDLKSFLDRLVREGEEEGLNIYYKLVSPGKRNRICTENIERALFVSADGTISPCAFTNIPASGMFHMAGEREEVYQRLTFGNATDEPILAIWQSKGYASFRASYGSIPHPICQVCPKLYEE